ncbi:MAG: glycosyl hydrolase family 79 C-terminal domain-containing protein [Solirubrobacteraceae bacterium]
MQSGPAGGRRRWLQAIVGVALVTSLSFAVLSISNQVDRADSDQPRAVTATVTVSPSAPPMSVPRGFFGLSTEYWTLPAYAPHLAVFERVLGLLHVRGSGPFVLRIGGDSADHTFWAIRARRLPAWALRLTPGWTYVARRLVHRLGLRLILDLNLITDTPAAAARWARAAARRLPRGSIAGFEVGNEPDIYSHTFWAAMTAGEMIGGQRLPLAVTAAGYAADFRAYASALAAASPHIALIGPALASPRTHWRWISTLLATHPPNLGTVSVHRYPYSACAHHRRSPVFPTVARLLSPAASTGMAASLVPALAAARHAGLPLRLTELNSVTCGGRRGVSNTFATALWVPDALFSLLRRGVSGVNLHLRANAINAPFVLGRKGLSARPLLYGLLMFARTLGPRARVVSVSVHAPRSSHLVAWAVRTGGRLRVLLIDKGARRVRVTLKLPATGLATVQRLLAPSPRAQSGVTLGGRWLDRRGRWHGRASHELVSPLSRGYVLTLPRYSAALISARSLP